MVKSDYKYLIASLLIHLSLFAYLNWNPPDKVDATAGTGNPVSETRAESEKRIGVYVEIKEVEHKVVNPVPQDDTEGVTRKQKKVDCDKWFGGIGVTTENIKSGVYVSKVHNGYPAKMAGLMAGDLIVWISDPDIRGPPGTSVTLKIMRDGRPMTFTIVRDHICY